MSPSIDSVDDDAPVRWLLRTSNGKVVDGPLLQYKDKDGNWFEVGFVHREQGIDKDHW